MGSTVTTKESSPDKKDEPAPESKTSTEQFVLVGGHGINAYKKCPKCNGTNFTVKNYDMMWHDGEVWCVDCNVYVREYDAG